MISERRDSGVGPRLRRIRSFGDVVGQPATLVALGRVEFPAGVEAIEGY